MSRSHSLTGIGSQHLFEQTQSLRLKGVVSLSFKIDVHFFVFLVNLLIFAAIEKCLPGEQNVKDDASRKNVALRLNMLALTERNDLRSHIARGATPKEQILLQISMSSQSEIYNNWLHGRAGPQHNVLRLEVAVHNPSLVHVLQS